jgi:hypothetical protein
MKKFFAIAMIFTFGIALSVTSCQTTGPQHTIEGKEYITEGWVDDDTFQLQAAGAPMKTATNKVVRREASKRAAILNAQYQMIEKFKGSQIEGAAGMQNFEMTGIAVAQQLKAFAKGGSVKSVVWDDEDNCSLIYVVHQKNLKKMAASAKWD